MRTIILRAAALTALVGVSLVFQGTVLAQEDCDNPDRNRKSLTLFITLANGAPSGVERRDPNLNANVNANRHHVCRGDQVTWRLAGQSFTLRFDDDSLFGGLELESDRGNSVTVEVSSGAERQREYKYDIVLANDQVLDPHIIVD